MNNTLTKENQTIILAAAFAATETTEERLAEAFKTEQQVIQGDNALWNKFLNKTKGLLQAAYSGHMQLLEANIVLDQIRCLAVSAAVMHLQGDRESAQPLFDRSIELAFEAKVKNDSDLSREIGSIWKAYFCKAKRFLGPIVQESDSQPASLEALQGLVGGI